MLLRATNHSRLPERRAPSTVVPNGKALSRARELAELHLKAPEVTRRNTRIHFIHGYVFQNLNAFVVNLAPNAGIRGVPERWPINIRNELPACARQDYDFVGSILRNAVEGIDKLGVSWRAHDERPAIAMEFSNQHTFGVPCLPVGCFLSGLCRRMCH